MTPTRETAAPWAGAAAGPARSAAAWALACLSALALAAPGHAADPPPQYMCIVNGVDDYTREFAPPSPGSARMVCTGTIHYALLRQPADLAAEVTAALDAAEASGYPVFLNFDDWNFPPDSWSLDPAITEWTDWQGTLASHRTIEWSADNPNNPPPNVAGPAFRAAVAPVFEAAFRAIAGRAAAWATQGRGHLFAGIAVGWESGYYTEFDETPAFRTGFAALTARGLTDQAIAAGAQQRGVGYWEEFDARVYDAVHDYAAWLGALAVAAGIPRAKVFTHFTGVPDDWTPSDPAQRDGRLVPFPLAGSVHASPGHTATPEWIDLERLAVEAAARGTPDWAAPEWEGTSMKGSRTDMLRYLSRLHGHGARVSCNWGGWWGAFLNPYEIHGTPGVAGMHAWLAGESLPGTGVAVGRSTLAGPLDYSDTWTEGAHGRVADGRFPVTGDALLVEDSHGHPPRAWSGSKWSLRRDDNVFWTLRSPDPRGNWSGSRRGMTETGGSVDFGIEYGLREDFVLQTDAVVTDDRIALTTASVRDTTQDALGLSVFFRPQGAAIEVGLFNATVEERDTGLRPALTPWTFENVAVRFDLPGKLVTIYAGGRRLGTLDLQTFAGGAFAAIPFSSAAVTIGGRTVQGDRVWTDNFQVGAPCPAPPAVGAGLRVRREGDDLVLDWRTDAALAYEYRAYSLSGPDFSTTTGLGTSAEKQFRHAGAAADATSFFYRVAAANDCGDEGALY